MDRRWTTRAYQPPSMAITPQRVVHRLSTRPEGRVPVPVGDSSTNPQDPSPSDINPSVDNCPEISPIYPQILPKSRKYFVATSSS